VDDDDFVLLAAIAEYEDGIRERLRRAAQSAAAVVEAQFPTNGYILEDASQFYITEDAIAFYVTET
jgi:hypothetical protein